MNINNKRLAVAFTGPSNSGKTTTIVKLSETLQDMGYKVSIIKHDPKDKAVFDKEGKDSYKFSKTGADVVVVSPHKTTFLKKRTSSIDDIISMLGEFDFLLVEGLKTIDLPRICIQRDEINENYFDVSDTIATDKTIEKSLFPKDMEILDMNDIYSLINWIKINGKKV
ncbi:MAG: molybdopterin-guanine dinucleotide biosynthesis protein B [Campylobacterota bacterium]|nr:molybdopterin-guanine dinucleotide biosynthesis protein B [Campylobacterota bacterium]